MRALAPAVTLGLLALSVPTPPRGHDDRARRRRAVGDARRPLVTSPSPTLTARDMPRRAGSSPVSTLAPRAACPATASTTRRARRRGLAWVAGSFLLCPCHLPLTLAVLASVLGGTALGAALHHAPLLAAAPITAVWAAGTWRGVRLVRASVHA